MPLIDTRAPTTTCVAPESFIAGVIAMLSSSVNASGRSATVARRTASGMRGPSTLRAKTKIVSVGATLPASAGASVRVPVMLSPLPAAAAGAAGTAGGEDVPAPRRFASSMLACTCWRNSLPAGSASTIFCHSLAARA